MSIPRPWRRLVAGMVVAGLAATAQAKPSAASREEKKASSASAATSTADRPDPGSFLRWLLLQNGGPDAISVPWPELVRAVTGKRVTPLDPGNPTDAAVTAKIGAALDQTLPRLNRADGPLRSATPLLPAEMAARVADELRATLGAAGGIPFTDLAGPTASGWVYPSLRGVDPAGGRTYYLSVTPYPSGGREGALRALAFPSAEGAGRIDADGCCLLVAVEHNGKAGKDLAFLNWELIDLAKVPVRCTVNFEADQGAVHLPGAVVTDGRKGRD